MASDSVGSYDYGHETLGSVEGGEFLDWITIAFSGQTLLKQTKQFAETWQVFHNINETLFHLFIITISKH